MMGFRLIAVVALLYGIVHQASAQSWAGWGNGNLECTEEAMTFKWTDASNPISWSIINLIKVDDWTTNPNLRWRNDSTSGESTISSCETKNVSVSDEISLEMKYADCEKPTGDAIQMTQGAETIVRKALIEVQPYGKQPPQAVYRALNNSQFALKCEYTRQINKTNTFNVTVKATIVKVELAKTAAFDVSMDFYSTEQFVTKESTPLEVVLNQKMFVKIEKTWNDTNLKMVVNKCWATDTAADPYEYKYPFYAQAGCGSDPTFKLIKESQNTFEFEINAFVFVKLKSQSYLHCTLYVCDSTNVAGECGKCTGSRKRRSIEQLLSRERRAVNLASLEMGRAVSSQIKYSAKPTCATLKCPSNSKCVENYPAFCRCTGNQVMNIHTKKCTDQNLVEMKVPTQLTWIDHYKSETSHFLRIAQLYEQKMIDYYVKEQRVSGIRGMKIMSATPQDSGAVSFKVMMTLADETTMERVSQQIRDLLKYKSEDVAAKTQVLPSTNIQILPVYIPVQKQESNTVVRDVVIGSVAVLIVLFVLLAFIIKRRDREETTKVVHVQGMDTVKVVPTDNKAFEKTEY